MVSYEEVRTKTVQCVVHINKGLIGRRRKGVHNSHMRYGRGSHLTNDQLLPGTLCIHILTHGHPAIVNLLGEGLSFRSKYIQYKILWWPFSLNRDL